MKALVAHLTETEVSSWEPYLGRKDGIGIEETFIEIGDFGPWDEDVAEMIRGGYTSGHRWKLTTEINLEENEPASLEIARLVEEGYTSGYGLEEYWEIEINKVEPRTAHVCVDDNDVTVTITANERDESLDYESTIDDLEADPDTSSLIQTADTAPKA
jgi:hypothetical protein